MDVLLGQLIYARFTGIGFKTLASVQVPIEIQQAFIQRVVARHWYSHKPPNFGYRAVYLHQVNSDQCLFGWLYSDGEHNPPSHVPYLICYYIVEPLSALQLENIFTLLHKGPVALIDRHSLPVSLETKIILDLWSYKGEKPGVAIPKDVRKHSHTALQQGELLDIFVPLNEDPETQNGQNSEQHKAKSGSYIHYAVRYIVTGIETLQQHTQAYIPLNTLNSLALEQLPQPILNNYVESASAVNEDHPTTTETKKPHQTKSPSIVQKRANILLLIYVVLAGCLAIGGLFLIRRLILTRTGEPSISQSVVTSESSATTTDIQERISLGNKILVTADSTANKKIGVAAFASGDFASAIAKLQSSLQQNRNDPEALIYLNNAKAAQSQVFKIAVSVPIGGNLDSAQEILRGVAQAQNQINQSGGIQGRLLQVEIANDDNDPTIAQNLAANFVKDSRILAVVGHNSSDASLTAAPVYQQGGLVMISPTSYASNLSGIGNYIFRTVPSAKSIAETLSRYALRTRIKNIAICADSKGIASQSFKEEFSASFTANGGKVVSTNCDFSAANFNPKTVISRAISDGAYGVLLSAVINNLNPAIDVIRANNGKLTLLGSQSLHTFKTVQLGQAGSNGMVLVVPWYPPAVSENTFSDEAAKLWGGGVNWRTAMAYDATQVIIAGLRQSNTRDRLQKVLASPGFSVKGATESVKFLPSGDRNAEANLITIEPGSASGTGYDFVPLSP